MCEVPSADEECEDVFLVFMMVVAVVNLMLDYDSV